MSHSRKVSHAKLSEAERERIRRYDAVCLHAARVLGAAEARRWLGSPQIGLGGEIPIEFCKTIVGVQEVEDLLGRIEHGVLA